MAKRPYKWNPDENSFEVSIRRQSQDSAGQNAANVQPSIPQDSGIPTNLVAQNEAELHQQLASQSSAQQQSKNISEAAQEIPALTQAAFQNQLTQQVGNTSSLYEAQIQAQLRQRVLADQIAQSSGRNPAQYNLTQGQLFNLDPDVVSAPPRYGVAIYPEQSYEQEQAVNYPRKLGEERFNAYMDAAVDRAAASYGTSGVKPEVLTVAQRNRAKARASEQLRIGAPIVPFDPTIEALKVYENPLMQLWHGAKQGWQQQNMTGNYNPIIGGGVGDNASYARSYLVDKYMQVRNKLDTNYSDNEPVYLYQDKPIAQKIGVELGRIAGDVTGAGTRKFLWNMHPEDVVNTYGKNVLKDWTSLDPAARRTTAWGAAGALGILSGNYNPINFAEGGRSSGFQAVSPDENDPRKSENAVMDYLVYRGMFGRSGRLLPWEQFTEERPEVSYDQYAAYQQYLKDPGFLGLAKGTMDGIDGPEARVMGYRVTPEGVLGAGAVLGTAMYLGRKR